MTHVSGDGGPAESAISIDALSKSYGNIKALDRTSLEVPGGMIFGLVGPNGSGKSTLIKAICGILRPDSGKVSVLGLDAMGERTRIRSQLGYMPQTPSLYEDLSPLENLRFFGGARGSGSLDADIEARLRFVHLWERRHDPLHTFSGGMKQRASLACAMLHDPRLLILDEPTAGVDPTLKQDFWRHFHELCDRGRTIFLSTNMMDEAMRCHRVAVIMAGGILVAESPQAIRNRGRTLVTLRLAGGSRTVELDDYPLELPRLLREYGLAPEVQGVSISQQSLEDVILAMLGGAGDEPGGGEATGDGNNAGSGKTR